MEIARLVNDAHAARAELALDPVVAERRSYHR